MSDGARTDEWIGMLHEFTNRNAGRRTVLEIVALEIGAQAEETDYPFWGAAYDPRDGRVQIMLGEQGSVDQHLTHSIGDATELDILRDETGRDQALRVVHDGGQTLLRFVEV